MSVYGLTGLGKSSFVARQILGVADRGVASLIAGDLKGEYTPLVMALGGQVLRFGEGQTINPLALGAMIQAAHRLGGERGAALRELAVQRAVDIVTALLQIVRGAEVDDWENTLLSSAVRILMDSATTRDPELSDLAHLLANPPAPLRDAILADETEYAALVKPLQRSLQALLRDGMFGATFDGPTSERVNVEAPAVSIDISAARQLNDRMLSAIMVATWGESFGTIEAMNALADGGLEPQRHYMTVMDEMWRAMRLPRAGLVDKMDSITRLNRADGVGQIYVTHSLKDAQSVGSAADVQKAIGFAERSGIIATAGLAKADLRALSEVRRMSEIEIDTVAGWSTPPGWAPQMIEDPTTGRKRPAAPPGAGKIFLKVGDRAGIACQVRLTEAEFALHDTNSRWVSEGSTPALELVR